MSVTRDGITITTQQDAGVGLTPKAPSFKSVGAASVEIVAANPARRSLVLVNESTVRVYLAFGAHAAVVGRGIVLMPNGGTWEMDPSTYTTLAVNGIASEAANVGVQEYD